MQRGLISRAYILQAALLGLMAVACQPRHDLRLHSLDVGDTFLDTGTFELEHAQVNLDRYVGFANVRHFGKARTKVLRLEAGELIEAEEWVEESYLEFTPVGGATAREVTPLAGMHVNAFRHQGVWERKLASGRLKLHQRYVLEGVMHPLGWELVPAEPMEVGATVELGPLEIAGLFGMPLYARVEGQATVTLDRVVDGVAYLLLLVDARIHHPGLGLFVFDLRGFIESELGAGLVRRYDLAGFIELPLRHLGAEGRVSGSGRMEGGFQPLEG